VVPEKEEVADAEPEEAKTGEPVAEA